MKRIYVRDGETIAVIAEVEPSVCDPLGQIATVANNYRVIANSIGPTLLLIPIVEKPVALADEVHVERIKAELEANRG